MLKFKYIKFKNFQSYGNSFSEYDLDTNIKTIIVGHNGYGKTVLLNTLSYVLFNKSYVGGSLNNPPTYLS